MSASEALSYLLQVKSFLKEHGKSFNSFLTLIHSVHNRRTKIADVIERVKDILGDRPDLLLGVNPFLPSQYQITLDELEENSSLQSAINFVNTVRLRFENNESAYKAFLDAINQRDNNGTEGEVDAVAILAKHPDLIDELARLVSSSQPTTLANNTDDEVCAREMDSEDLLKRVHRKGFNLLEKVKDCSSDPDEYINFLKHLHDYSRKADATTMDDLKSLTNTKYPHLKAEFEELVDDCHNIGRYKRQKLEKKTTKAMKELDFSTFRHCSPSYWHQPTASFAGNYKSSPRSEELNDECISKPSGGDNFKSKTVNAYEEILNRCEDDRHEIDVLLNRLLSAAEKIKEILRKIDKNKISMAVPFNATDHLSILHLKCIERLYGDCGVDVIELLNENALVALPIVQKRLQEKAEELQAHLFNFNKLMTAVQVENHLMLNKH